MPSPDVPDCFAIRRLNPFLGVAQVPDIGIGRAISIDGVSWQIQIRGKLPASKRSLEGCNAINRKYFRFGHWSAAAGLVHIPVNPELDNRQMFSECETLLELLGTCAGNVPFCLEVNIELWLLDHDRLPLAMLASAVREELVSNLNAGKWWATLSTEEGFHSSAPEARGYPNMTGGGNRGHATFMEQQVMNAASGHCWFIRHGDGAGRVLYEDNNCPDIKPDPGPDYFPKFPLRNYWESDDNTAVADNRVQWLAPCLLTLQSLDDSTRSALEHAARTNAALVDGQFRLYPRVINGELLESARVESRMPRSATPSARRNSMRVTTTDPMTGNDVADLDNAPFVIEGQGHDALKIYFESVANRQEYLDISMNGPDSTLLDALDSIKDNETMRTIN